MLVGAGVALTVTAGVMAATTDDRGRGPVMAFTGLERPYVTVLAVDVEPTEVSFVWTGNGDLYRVSVGDDLDDPVRTVVTAEPRAVIEAPRAADPNGRVGYRVEVVTEAGTTTAAVEGTLTLLPTAPSRPRVEKTTTAGAVVRWKPGDYATTYDVAVSRSKHKIPATVHRLTDGRPRFATDSLKPDTTYWIRARSVGEAGVSRFGPPVKLTTPPAETALTVGAWNICSQACLGYSGRVGPQSAQVHASEVDVMTLQEAGGKRVGPITRAHFSGGPRRLVMASGGGDSRYVLYSSDRFDQLGGGRWPLGHGRWAAWARLEERQTQRRFIVVSVHLLNGHDATGQRAAEMRTLMSALGAVNTEGDPVILAGDFNSGTHRRGDTVGPIVRAHGFRDAVEIAEQTVAAQVNTGSRRGDEAILSGDHVDHIYVSEAWTVSFWKQWAALSGTTYVGPWLSDHNMITATVSLPVLDESAIEPSATEDVAREAAAPGSAPPGVSTPG